LLAGTDAASASKTFILLNREKEFSLVDTIPALQTSRVFTGDLNGDGRCDISLLGHTANSDSLNLILHSNNTYDTLDAKNIHSQAFGDFDRDGDLDLMQLKIWDNIALIDILDTCSCSGKEARMITRQPTP
jgi:hypothetical protein